MNKVERLQAAVSGKSVDEIPYAFWSHFPGIDSDPVKLADNTYEFYKRYDLDFIKTMPNGMYAVEDYGCKCDYQDILSGGAAKVMETPIKSYQDWEKIAPLSVEKGALHRELLSLDLLLKKLRGEVPVIVTVFSPLTIAQKVCKHQLLEYVNNGQTELLHQALGVIAETVGEYSAKAIELGAAGVFMATQLSTFDSLTEEQYNVYGVPYDKKALSYAKDGWLNALHIHGNNIMFDLLKDYPVQVINWHVWETEPTIKEARKLTSKCLMGGIKRYNITNMDRGALHEDIRKSIEESQKIGHILTPGCVIRYPIDEETLTYVKNTKKEIEKSLMFV